MLMKLLKYDLKWVYKVIAVFYTLALVFSVMARLLGQIQDSVLFSIIADITRGIAITMMINIVINNFIRLWVRFIRNLYKDESYLTHTLPVEKKEIFLSKVLSAIIIIFTTTIVVVSCLFICFYSESNFESLKALLNITAGTLNITVFNLLLVVTAILFVQIMFIVLIGYAAIIIGHKSNKNKMVKTVIIGFGMYMLCQIVMLGIVLIFGSFDPSIMNLINTTTQVDANVIIKLLIICIVVYFIYNVIYYAIGKKQFEKGVNIE